MRPMRSNIPIRMPTSCSKCIAPQRAVLEGLINPSVAELQTLNALSEQALGDLPPEDTLVLFIWSASRVVPVRVTSSRSRRSLRSQLNPLRAKVSLGMRVMTTDDLGFDHRGSSVSSPFTHARSARRQDRSAPLQATSHAVAVVMCPYLSRGLGNE